MDSQPQPQPQQQQPAPRTAQHSKPRHFVIIGGGVIGCTTAYYLTRHPSFDKTRHRVTILEAASIAAGASGKAGGLLGKWAYPDPLVALSYRLHAELAAEHGGEARWGYRTLGCGSIEAVGQDRTQLNQIADEASLISPAPGNQNTNARFVLIGDPDPTTPPQKHNQGKSATVPTHKEKESCAQNRGGNVKRSLSVSGKKPASVLNERIVAQPPPWLKIEDFAIKIAPRDPTEPRAIPNRKRAAPKRRSSSTPDPISPNNTSDHRVSSYNTQEAIVEQILRNLKELTASQSPKEWEKLPKQDPAAASLLVPNSPLPRDLDWFDGLCVKTWAEMGVPGINTDTAQVHPFHFTTSIAQLARESGVNIIEGAKVTVIKTGPKLGVHGVIYKQRFMPLRGGGLDSEHREEPTIHIDDVTDAVVCAGPWTGKILPKANIGGPRAHSVVYDVDVSPYAVFSEIKLPSGFVPEHRRNMGQARTHKEYVDPEVYARPFNEVYACGETDHSVPLPETADLVETDLEACDDITAYLSTVSPTLGSAPVKTRQACYLPLHTHQGKERGPLIGKTTTPGLYIASGHSCWGIQNGPATGKLMSELLLEGKTTSASIAKFDPKKLKVGGGVIMKRAVPTGGRE